MNNQANNTKVDIDYTHQQVPAGARRGFWSMFMIMMGFTFFSASMWVGQKLAEGLDLYGFVGALILGGVILGAYTGALGYVGGESGLSLDNLAIRSFGRYGSYLPSAMISFTQIGWFGVGLAMFAIPVATQLLGDNKTYEYLLVAIAGICMTANNSCTYTSQRHHILFNYSVIYPNRARAEGPNTARFLQAELHTLKSPKIGIVLFAQYSTRPNVGFIHISVV